MVQARSPQRGDSTTTPLVAQEDGLANDGLIPQIFSSVPALSEAASYFAQTTSYFTGCFSDYSVENSSRHSGASDIRPQELVTFASAEAETSSSTEIDHISSNRNHLTSVESSNTSTSASAHVHDEITITAGGDPLQNASALVESNNTGQSGISIFKSLIDRARRTVRGSADDIGWLQRAPGMPPVEDGTERFLEILGNIKHGVHKLPNSVVYLLIPGSDLLCFWSG